MSISREEDESFEGDFSVNQKLWHMLIKSSFMTKLSVDSKQSVRVGHEMEKGYARTLVEDSSKGAI
eukprot:11675881-Ditylum_brightwellii.AAC.1